eukprot:symbB.v1.2.015739.t1/scaffold1123.1/size136624/4
MTAVRSPRFAAPWGQQICDLRFDSFGRLTQVELQTLRNLDLSNCLLEAEKPLEVLRQLPILRKLKVNGNPFTEAGNTTVRVLICHWRLESVDDVSITQELREHLEEAKALNQQRVLEERERLKEEAAKADDA